MAKNRGTSYPRRSDEEYALGSSHLAHLICAWHYISMLNLFCLNLNIDRPQSPMNSLQHLSQAFGMHQYLLNESRNSKCDFKNSYSHEIAKNLFYTL